jgi:hypothetical protein
MGNGNGVSADVLRDTAGFTGSDIGLSDNVKQRGLAVINVAHNGDDRRTRLELLGFVLNVFFDLANRSVDLAGAALAFLDLESAAIFRANLLRDELINRLVDRRENAE